MQRNVKYLPTVKYSKAHRIRLYEHLRKYKKIIRNLYFVYVKMLTEKSIHTSSKRDMFVLLNVLKESGL